MELGEHAGCAWVYEQLWAHAHSEGTTGACQPRELLPSPLSL